MSVVKCDKHNVIFNPHNEVCASCYSDEKKEVAYTPSLLQELRNKADFVAIKENKLSELKSQLTAAQAEIKVLKAKLEKSKELAFGEIQQNGMFQSEYDDVINSITLESLKIENARASAKNQMELSKVLDDNEDR